MLGCIILLQYINHVLMAGDVGLYYIIAIHQPDILILLSSSPHHIIYPLIHSHTRLLYPNITPTPNRRDNLIYGASQCPNQTYGPIHTLLKVN